jgi:hypothetical protein
VAPPPAEGPKAAWAEYYLPLVVGSEYIYASQYQGNATITTLKVKAGGGKTAFYTDGGPGKALLGSSFFKGVAEVRPDGLYAAPADDEAAAANPPPLMKIVSTPVNPGEELSLQSPELDARTAKLTGVKRMVDIKIKAIGLGKLTVRAGTFDTLELRIKDGNGEESKVWLAKGVGVVKWERASGRVEELDRFKIPKD